MKIAGIDPSITSSGVIVYDLDDNLDINSIDYLGFTDKISLAKSNDKLILNRKQNFKHDIFRFSYIAGIIYSFVEDCDYLSYEGYSFGSVGNTFNLGEFGGILKFKLMGDAGENFQPIPLRIYEPTVLKMYASGSGACKKLDMYNAWLKLDKRFDLKGLPEVIKESGAAVTSDLIDATFLAELLRLELKLRKGLILMKDLNETEIKVFNRVSKSSPVNILAQDFIGQEKDD